MLCMANICSQTYFEIARCTRVAVLAQHHDALLQRVGLLTSNLKRILPNKTAIFSNFLPAMASNHTSMNYNRPVKNLAGLVLKRLNVLIVGGAKISLPIKRTSSNRRIFPYH